MEGLNWRIALLDLKVEINNAKKNGISNVRITTLEKAINDIESNIALEFEQLLLDELNGKSAKAKLEKNLDKYVALQKERNEGHRQYTNLLISAGYASYFGLWAVITSRSELVENINHHLINTSLVLISISIFSFIILEVANVAIDGYGIHFNNQVLIKVKAEDNLNLRENNFSEFGKYDDYLRMFLSNFWVWSYPISVVTGLFGLFILIFTLLNSLNIFG